MKIKSLMKKAVAIVAAAGMLISGNTFYAKAEGTVAGGGQDAAGRVKISFNNDWKFYSGNISSAYRPEYDDSQWLYVNVPHSTVKYTPENYLHADRGIYWYRKHFTTPETVKNGRRVLLTFEGAMQKADVYLNGESLGTHKGGYTVFSYDITDKLKSGAEENILSVRLDTNPNPMIAPGHNNPGFQYFGGLYRNVYVTVTDPIHVTDAVSSDTVGGGGVFLTTTAADETSASVNAKTEVENHTGSAQSVTVKTEIFDMGGTTPVATENSTQSVGSNAKVTFKNSLTVSNPRLWSTDTPELYKVVTTVSGGGTVYDVVENTFGIRTVDWRRDGCYINGERVELIGTNAHSEIYMLGNALSDDAIDAEVKRIRENGFNFVRMAHYPHAPAFYAACDKYGVAVLECLAGWQHFSNEEEFKNNTYSQMREMVRNNRNHPSIVAWEPSLNESPFTAEWARNINQVTKDEYPVDGAAKAWTCGWQNWEIYDFCLGTPQARVVEKAGNYPNKAVIVSEYGDWNYGGHQSASRVTREEGAYSDVKGGDEGMLAHCDNLQSAMAYNRRQTEWYGATAYWQYADYAGFNPHLNLCGVVDVARIPKFGTYFFKSQRDPRVDLSEYGIESGPMVFIANTWAGNSPSKVRIFSNCDKVALYYNGNLIEERTPDTEMYDPRGNIADLDGQITQIGGNYGKVISTKDLAHPPFTFDLTNKATPGSGTLKAVGYIGGEEKVVFERKAPGQSTKIVLEPENDAPLKLDGGTSKLVWFKITNDEGTVSNTASNKVTFTTEGPGYVVGAKEVAARGGVWAVWVHSKRPEAGQGAKPVVLRATSANLEGASLEIKTVAVEGLPDAPEGGDVDDEGYVQPADLTNIFEGKPATAISENTKGNGDVEAARLANDGNDETRWCADNPTSDSDRISPKYWWQVDLGIEYQIREMSINFAQAAGSGTPFRYQIVASNDMSYFESYDPNAHSEDTKTAAEREVTHNFTDLRGRYVRIYLNCPKNTLWPCIREVRGYGESANIAFNKPVTAVASQGGKEPGKAVDGDASSHWCKGSPGPGWFQVDLGADYLVDSAAVTFLWAGSNDTPVRHKFTLQASPDAKTWSDVASYSDVGTSGAPVATANVDVPEGGVEARYLRVNGLEAVKSGSAQWVEIAEFTATGTKLAKKVRMELNKSAESSSDAEGVEAGNGTDGNPSTFWKPAVSDANPYWQFDSEGLYSMSGVTLTWETDGEHKYRIQISTDKENWTTVADHMTDSVSGYQTYDSAKGYARYVRVCVEQGATEGFWLSSSGRYLEEKRKVAEVITSTFDSVTAQQGTPLSELPLSSDAKVKLDDNTVMLIPIEWSDSSYDSSSVVAQTVKGSLKEIVGIDLEDKNFEVETGIALIPGSSYAKGDVNNDGNVNLLDLRLVLRHICQKNILSGEALAAADVTGNDGVVNLLDLRVMLRFICGKITSL